MAVRVAGDQPADAVRGSVADGRFPLVLSGSCDAALGVLAGLDRRRLGIVWLDAHGDFNTPDTATSGFFAGMALAVAVGHCYPALSARIGNDQTVRDADVALFGARMRIAAATVATYNPDRDPDGRTRRLAARLVGRIAWSAHGAGPDRTAENQA